MTEAKDIQIIHTRSMCFENLLAAAGNLSSRELRMSPIMCCVRVIASADLRLPFVKKCINK